MADKSNSGMIYALLKYYKKLSPDKEAIARSSGSGDRLPRTVYKYYPHNIYHNIRLREGSEANHSPDTTNSFTNLWIFN